MFLIRWLFYFLMGWLIISFIALVIVMVCYIINVTVEDLTGINMVEKIKNGISRKSL